MIHRLISSMIHAFSDLRYVEHALKVLGYARAIGGCEGISGREMTVLEAAAAIHDIGIPEAIRKSGSGAGPYQEREGALIAPDMLRKAGYEEDAVKRATFLIAHHHSPEYASRDGLLQLLLEADDLVNLSEGIATPEKIAQSRAALFKTATGLCLLDLLFAEQ